ncbi:MAG: T9SS type A sorting domain-containing protein [Ignavibacteriae bacterium]|nr:T9SS type A sorting domain-containing protein [Ignavibacteriota bacterium]
MKYCFRFSLLLLLVIALYTLSSAQIAFTRSDVEANWKNVHRWQHGVSHRTFPSSDLKTASSIGGTSLSKDPIPGNSVSPMGLQGSHSLPFTIGYDGRIVFPAIRDNSHSLTERVTVTKEMLSPETFLVIQLLQNWDGSAWVNFARYLFFYGVGNVLASQIYQTWNGSDWVNQEQLLFTYTGVLLTQILIQRWIAEAWEDYQVVMLYYDKDDRLVEEVLQQRQDGTWVNLNRVLVTYNTSGLVAQWLFMYWFNEAWENSFRWSLAYNVKLQVIEELFEYWLLGAWVNLGRYLYTYEALAENSVSGQTLEAAGANTLLLYYIYQSWVSNAWQDVERGEYSYNKGGKASELYEYEWMNDAWVLRSRILFAYTLKLLLLEELVQRAIITSAVPSAGENTVAADTTWEDVSRTTNTYDDLSAVGDGDARISSFRLLNNYPNPFNPVTTIAFEIPQSEHVVLKVYNVLGGEVSTLVNGVLQPNAYTVKFDASNLPNGVYYYRLTAGSYTKTMKLMLMK